MGKGEGKGGEGAGHMTGRRGVVTCFTCLHDATSSRSVQSKAREVSTSPRRR